MKTKHILTALALPAMFAACTAEDIVSENSSIQQDRAKLSENFALVVGADGVESRYNANGGAPEFETGDKIGAALIDQYKYNTPVAQWPIISSLANNTPFTYDATAKEWSVPENQPMGIGNYFFKFPYSNTDRSRAAVIYSLPTVQNQYVDVDGEVDLDEVIETSNMAIAHAILTEDDEMGEISLKNIFTYPKFRIQFDNGQKVNTVSKVVLYSNSDFVVGSGFNHNAVVNYFNNVKKKDSWTNNHYDATAKATKWNEVETYDLIYTTNPTDGVAKVETSKYLVAKFPNDAEVSYDSNTENKYIDVRFVLPAVKNAVNTTYSMLVYTDNGMYKYTNVYNAIEFKKTTSKEVKEAVFARNKNYNLTLEALDEVEDDETMIVASKQDWNEIVDVYGDVKGGKYTVVVVGDEFGFDETTEMPEVATITIDGPAYVKGEATLSNIIVKGKTYVEEGAVLTTSATFDPKKAIVNEGEVVIAQVLDAKGKVEEYNKIETIENNGTLTINEDTKATFALKNAKKAVVENNGKITVTGTSNGEITNNGEFNSNGFTINFQDNKPNDGKSINESYFYNNGEVFSKAGSFENNGNIVNNEDAVMTCKNQDGTIDNKSELEVVDGSVTYITSNSGNITVDKSVPAELVVKNNTGSISYEGEGSLNFKNSLVNTLHVTDDVTIADKGSLTTICVDADAEITLPAAADITKLTVSEDVVASLESNLTVTSLTLAEGAELNIPAGVKLTVKTNGGTIANEGTIRVAGSFYAQGILATADGVGTIKDNGTSAEVKFYDAETAALTAAWNSAVSKWANGRETSEGWNVWMRDVNKTQYYNGNPYDYRAFYAVATNSYWATDADIVALGNTLTEPKLNADGSLKEIPARFKDAVDNLLKETNNAKAAKAVLYNADGKFQIGWSQKNDLFETVAEMYTNMSERLNTVAQIDNKFAGKPVVAAYVWADQATVWNKLNAANPYAYVWKSTEDLVCPLYDVCLNIMQASTTAWAQFFGTSFTSEATITAKYVKDWLQAAAAKTDDTTLGKIAKKMSDAYYTSSLKWEYNDTQVSSCCNAALVELTGNASSY